MAVNKDIGANTYISKSFVQVTALLLQWGEKLQSTARSQSVLILEMKNTFLSEECATSAVRVSL